MQDKIPIVAVVGATASGKTALAIEIARHFGGEIVSCDSMQIYRTLDIGTAKPTVEEQQSAVHHLIDILNPDESCSAAQFCQMAHSAIKDIHSRGKLPVLAGGTGLYVDNIVYNTDFSAPKRDKKYSGSLEEYAARHGNAALHNMLKEADPAAAQKYHPNDIRRVIRALETLRCTGKTRAELDGQSRLSSPYDCVYLAIDMERELLYERINKRVDIMLAGGLINEARRLYEIRENLSTAIQAIGYRELFSYFDNEVSLEEAVGLIKRNSRRYAKRQLTWFGRNENVHWLQSEVALEQSIRIIKERFYNDKAN